MKERIAMALFLLLLAATLSACAGRHKAAETGATPSPFTLEFRALHAGRRSVFYQLDADGSLYFGGGRDAQNRVAPRSAGTLTEDEAAQVWGIVRRHKLLAADGVLFPRSGQSRYEVEVRAGSRRNEFKAADDDVPGLKELDEALFKLQARKRFDEQTEGIVPRG